MARLCGPCGRPLDGEHHEILGRRIVITPRGRGRVGMQRVRVYRCRVRAITDDLIEGRKVPETMRRTRLNPARYVPVGALESEGYA